MVDIAVSRQSKQTGVCVCLFIVSFDRTNGHSKKNYVSLRAAKNRKSF